MVHYKLTYFDARGRAEIVRLLFTYGDVIYQDERLQFDEYPKLKPKTPFQGGLPLLTVDGVVFTQSQPITRFVAQLVGKSQQEQLRADMIVQQLSEIRDVITPILVFERDEAIKTEKIANFEKEKLIPVFTRLEEMVKKDCLFTKGHLVGDKLTYADLYLMDTMDLVGQMFDMGKYPKLVKLSERTAAIPKIAKWREARPVTQV